MIYNCFRSWSKLLIVQDCRIYLLTPTVRGWAGENTHLHAHTFGSSPRLPAASVWPGHFVCLISPKKDILKRFDVVVLKPAKKKNPKKNCAGRRLLISPQSDLHGREKKKKKKTSETHLLERRESVSAGPQRSKKPLPSLSQNRRWLEEKKKREERFFWLNKSCQEDRTSIFPSGPSGGPSDSRKCKNGNCKSPLQLKINNKEVNLFVDASMFHIQAGEIKTLDSFFFWIDAMTVLEPPWRFQSSRFEPFLLRRGSVTLFHLSFAVRQSSCF